MDADDERLRGAVEFLAMAYPIEASTEEQSAWLLALASKITNRALELGPPEERPRAD